MSEGKSCSVLFVEDHRIICHVFMDISDRGPLPHILWQRRSHHCPNLILWTGEKIPRDVFAQVTVQWH